jgi:Redoxin
MFRAIVLAAMLGCDRPSATPQKSEGGGIAAVSSTALLAIDGRPFDLWQNEGNDAASTVVVFTRTDCPISNRYAPTVKKLHEAFQPRGVRFYLVYVDPKEGPDEIRRHLKEFDYPCPGLRDPSHSFIASTGATVTPEAVVFDAAREVVYRGRIDDLYAGYGEARDEATTHELADAIAATLAGQPVAQSVTEAVGCPISDLQ